MGLTWLSLPIPPLPRHRRLNRHFRLPSRKLDFTVAWSKIWHSSGFFGKIYSSYVLYVEKKRETHK